MNTLENLLNQLGSKIPFSEAVNEEISKSDVAWHIEHTLLTLNGITDFLIQANPKNYRWSFNFIRIVVLTMKKIPRGRAKAPEIVQPKGSINKESLHAHVGLTKNKIKALAMISKENYFTHPFFGDLKLNQTIGFLEIHTKHHLEIIEDINNKNKNNKLLLPN